MSKEPFRDAAGSPRLRAFSLALCMTSAVWGLAACGDEDDKGGDAGVAADSGVDDADAGARDGSRPDSGIMPNDASVSCPPGTEGCPCNSSVTAQTNPLVFLKDDCVSADLRCVAFDLGYRVSAPVQGCVKPCTSDNECGAGRICRESGYPSSTGVGRICFDQQANVEEYCHLSRLTASRTTSGNPPQPVPVRSGAVMRGCAENVDCLGGIFASVHPDEGICARLCARDADCTPEAPYCNPKLLVRTSTSGTDEDVGVCSFRKNGPGASCGAATPLSSGLASRCDTAVDDLICLRVTGLFPGSTGFCAQLCGANNPCEGSEPGVGAYNCTITDPMDLMEGGVCTSTCTNFPENCGGMGARGQGRMCLENRIALDDTPVSFCIDRQPPTLTPTVLGPSSILTPGQSCTSANTADFARCPEPTTCDRTANCVAGCAPLQTPNGCEGLTATGTVCTALPPPNQDAGFCTR